MIATRTVLLLAVQATLAWTAAGCGQSGAEGDELAFPVDPQGKADVLGRGLAGVAAPYHPDSSLAVPEVAERLNTDAAFRRQVAWNTAKKVLEPVPVLGLIDTLEDNEEVDWDGEKIPEVPRFQTWYGIDDIKRMFQHLYEQLDEGDRLARKEFSRTDIADAVEWNARSLERSDRWPLSRYLDYVGELGSCEPGLSDSECYEQIRSQLGGATGGVARIMYSPGTAEHILAQYSHIDGCRQRLKSLELSRSPRDAERNFSECLAEEFPTDAVLIKAHWVRADFGRDLPAYNTDAMSLGTRLAGTAHWGDDGDRRTSPDAQSIYTIELRDGSRYRLAGIHIMTKEVRHWQWLTLWWSDQPSTDFGADRPSSFANELPAVWSNYKLCAVSWFDEQDPELAKRFAGLPSLQEAINAAGQSQQPTWCSNPYLEHGRGNAGTNCIGCHQHGGSTVAYDLDSDGTLEPLDLEAIISDETLFPERGRVQIRDLFPADYLYSINRVDDFAGMIRAEIAFFDDADRDAISKRLEVILSMVGRADRGQAIFTSNCSGCHGPDGRGTISAPNLYQRVPPRSREALLQSLLFGRGAMPAWGPVFQDQELADLITFLVTQFGSPTGTDAEG